MIISPDLDLCEELTSDIESVGVETDCVRSFAEAIETLGRKHFHAIFTEAVIAQAKALDLLPHLDAEDPPMIVVLCGDESAVAMLADIGPSNVVASERPMNKSKLRKLLRELQQSGGCGVDGGNTCAPTPCETAAAFDETMLGNCESMREVYDLIARVGPTDATVLVIGESGTGKELVACAVHERSDRSDKPFIAINCGAIPESLIESELFGHVKGAFTGAENDRAGVFERAHGGTLFLDEITEMSVEMQVRLLRVLEEHRYVRVGGSEETEADVRLIAATNRDPAQAVSDGELREDLLYRISVFPMQLPPLRARGEDVVLLANHFLSAHNRANETEKRLSDRGNRRLMSYGWPGNVRQLRNMIERAYILEDDTIHMDCLTPLIAPSDSDIDGGGAAEVTVMPAIAIEHTDTSATPAESAQASGSSVAGDDGEVVVPVGASIDDAERMLIEKTLDELDGDKKQAAEVLGISLKTLYNRLKSYGADDS